MKKFCLSLVLSVVSVFTISAQTAIRPTAAIDSLKDAKTEPAAEQTAAVTQNDKPLETDVPAEKKSLPTSDAAKAEPVNEPVKAAVAIETVKKLEPTALVKTPALTEQPRPRAVDTTKNPGLPVSPMSNTSLEGLSTGNAAVDGYIEEFSALYNVDPLLIYAQMSQESSFKGRATSSKGASGYMQLMPDTARRFGVSNIYNPKQNIHAGVKYMRWLLDKFGGDMRLALAGYNAGEGSVMKYGNKIPPYRETQNYVTKIMNHYDLLSTQGLVVAKND
jgi:soluble lytic murein transglycosylase-like protein